MTGTNLEQGMTVMASKMELASITGKNGRGTNYRSTKVLSPSAPLIKDGLCPTRHLLRHKRANTRSKQEGIIKDLDDFLAPHQAKGSEIDNGDFNEP
jgi:hypothetical protein